MDLAGDNILTQKQVIEYLKVTRAKLLYRPEYYKPILIGGRRYYSKERIEQIKEEQQ